MEGAERLRSDPLLIRKATPGAKIALRLTYRQLQTLRQGLPNHLMLLKKPEQLAFCMT